MTEQNVVLSPNSFLGQSWSWNGTRHEQSFKESEMTNPARDGWQVLALLHKQAQNWFSRGTRHAGCYKHVCVQRIWLDVPVDACVAGQKPITAIYGLLSRPVVTKRLSGSCNNGLSYCEHAARASIDTLTDIGLAHIHTQLFACPVSPLYCNSWKSSRPHPQLMRS